MNTEKYTQEVNVIKERFDNDLQELGLRIRNEVVAPACKNHGLKFFSGNGTFFFAKGESHTPTALLSTPIIFNMIRLVRH